MNQPEKKNTKKPVSKTKKTKGRRANKQNPKKNIRKTDPNKLNTQQKKNVVSKQPNAKKEPKETEVDFISKDSQNADWTIESIERYIIAVKRAFEKIPETEKEEVDLREIWMNSSLPPELILKIITDHGEKVGIKPNTLFLDGKIVF